MSDAGPVADGAETVRDGDFGARATSGAILLTVRTVATRAIGLLTSVVLARLLVPDDFGLLALGLTLTSLVGFAANAGFGAALVRRPETPAREDLQAVLFLQFWVAAAAVPVLFALVPIFGETVAIGAVMLLSLPIGALRFGDYVLLERDLKYGPIARVDVVEVLVQSSISIVLVALGAGIWGVALATPIKAIVGTALLWRLGPVGPLMPRFSRPRLKALAGEGSLFAAQEVVGLARDQGLNIAIGTLGGLGTLGAYALTTRIMLIPGVVLSSLWQVAFPAMSRMRSTVGSLDEQTTRALGLTSVGLAIPVAVIIGTHDPLVHVVFGPQWDEAAAVLPWLAAGVLIAGPASVAFGSALYAEQRGRVVLASAVLHSIALIGVSVAFFPYWGLTAVGVGAVAAGVVEVLVFGWAFSGDTRRCLSFSGGPVLASAAGAASGIAVGSVVPESAFGLLVQAAASVAATVIALLLFGRAPLTDFVRLIRRANNGRVAGRAAVSAASTDAAPALR